MRCLGFTIKCDNRGSGLSALRSQLSAIFNGDDMKQLEYSKYLDKVLGCWIGKSIGGVIGAPFEGHKIFGDLTPDKLWPDTIYLNDDLDIQIIWLEMMEECGSEVTHKTLAKYWRDRCWYNFCEYGAFLYNEQRGIHAPVSGDFNNSFFKESEGCPIRAEVWAMVAPGNPRLAAEYAWLDGTQDHVGDSVQAEMFWAACNAAAFLSSDLKISSQSEEVRYPRTVRSARYRTMCQGYTGSQRASRACGESS